MTTMREVLRFDRPPTPRSDVGWSVWEPLASEFEILDNANPYDGHLVAGEIADRNHAYLIAAAPKLLAAAQLLLSTVEERFGCLYSASVNRVTKMQQHHWNDDRYQLAREHPDRPWLRGFTTGAAAALILVWLAITAASCAATAGWR